MQTATEWLGSRLKTWGMGALLVGLVLVCYAPARHGALIFDDPAHITRPELQPWSGLGRIWFEAGATAQYYPLFNTALWVEHRLWGDAVVGYHLVNVLLHAAAACLVVAITRRLLDAGSGPADSVQVPNRGTTAAGPARHPHRGAEWLAGFIFALHPVCVESVAWISEQKNTLSAVFFLGAALAYLGFDRDRRRARYWLAFVLFVLALLTKTVTATLPPTLLVVFAWQRGRLAWRRDVLPLLPWFVVGAAAGLYTAWFEQHLAGAHGPGFALPLLARILIAGRAVWFYLRTLVWPSGLMFINPRWTVNLAASWQYLYPAAAVALAGILWLGVRRAPPPLARAAAGGLAGYLVFIGSLLPALGFVDLYWFTYSYVADHFQYLASLGIIVPLAAGLTRATDSWRRSGGAAARAVAPAVAGLLVAGFGVLTWQQSGTYRDGETLYRATLARNPACWVAHNNLAWELGKSPAGMPEALQHYEQALRLNPGCAEAHDNLANLLATLPGRELEAVEHFQQALRLRPDFVETHLNLANLLAKLPGRAPEALTEYEAALRLAPDLAEAHYSLANALAQIPGRSRDAVAQYEEALRLKPDLAQAHVNLANELAKLPSRMPEALAHYDQALRINPGLAAAHYDLAVQLSDLPGREADALHHFEEALRLRPDYVKARNDLGVLYARQGRFDEARQQWERALQLDPHDEDARRNLDLLRKRQSP